MGTFTLLHKGKAVNESTKGSLIRGGSIEAIDEPDKMDGSKGRQPQSGSMLAVQPQKVVPLVRLERTTHGLGNRCSIL